MAFKSYYHLVLTVLIYKSPLFAEVKPPALLVVETNSFLEVPLGAQDSIVLQKKDLVSLKDLGKRLVIFGKKDGDSLLKIGAKNFHLVSMAPSTFLAFQRLQRVIQELPELSLDFRDKHIRVRGKLHDASSWISIANLHIEDFLLETNIPEKDLRLVELEINERLSRSGYFNIKLSMEPFPTVRLPKMNPAKPEMMSILNHFGVHIKIDENRLNIEELIRVQVTLIEMRKSHSQQMGLEWPHQMSAQLLAKGLIPTDPIGTVSLNWFAQKGHGKILAAPVLVTRNGSEADFFAGGEFPIKTKTKQTQTIQWKRYGISLKIKPKTDSDGKLSIELRSEVSSIDSGEKIDGIPSLFTNTMSTHFDLQEAQTIALSGLIKKIDGETIKLWPSLGELPILGSLFQSRDYQEDLTELLVLVTPTILKRD